MKNNILYFFIVFCLQNIELFAQQDQPKSRTETVNAISVNFLELAKAEKLRPKPFEGKVAPEEGDEENEKKMKANNVVTSFSPMQKIQTILPPALPIKNINARTENTEAFPCTTFEGVINNDIGGFRYEPSDANGGVGFDHVVSTTNTYIRISNKQGGFVSEQTFVSFFSVLGITDVFDPKIHYDPYAHRWVFVGAATRTSANSSFIIAISQTPDPTGGWWQYAVDADAANANWFDYPEVGINKNWIVITGNMFTIAAGSNYGRVWAINKSQGYIGAGLSIPYWDYSAYRSISPSTNYDINEDRMWLMSNFNYNSGGNGFVKIFNMTGTAAAPLLALGNTINVGTGWGGPNGGPQLGTAVRIDLNDPRIQSAVYRNGVLWFSQGIGLPAVAPTYSSIQVVAVNPFAGSHIETLRIGDASGAIAAGFPWVAINSVNDICIGYNTFYTTGFPSSAISVRRSGSGSFESYVYKSGEVAKANTRFGDYSSCYVDPEDDRTFWVSTEYARTSNRWGTWWAKLCPAYCINDQTVTGIVGANYLKKFETSNTITATVQIGTGANVKLDAANKITLSPGFRANNGSKVQVYIEGCGGAR